MKQITATSVEDVLRWIEATPHHRAAWRPKSGRGYARFDDPEAVLVLDGRHDRLRIPLAIQVETRSLTRAGDAFDTRMFRANEAGLSILRKADGDAA